MPIAQYDTRRLLMAACGAMLAASVGAADADAASSKKASRESYGTVTAISITTAQRVTAPVRKGRWGDEVRMPSGYWTDCSGDCRETLRVKTIDFFVEMEQRDHQNK